MKRFLQFGLGVSLIGVACSGVYAQVEGPVSTQALVNRGSSISSSGKRFGGDGGGEWSQGGAD